MTVAAAIGFLSSFLQMLEKLELLANPRADLFCNINAVFSCNNILNAWQSSVFGFPNALMCLIFFTVMLAAGIIGWSNGVISKATRLTLHGMTLFFVGFGFWYLWQSIFVVGAMCIYCIGCYGAVLALAHAWLRLNYKDLPLNKRILKLINRLVASGCDLLVWIGIGLAIVVELIIQFS